MIEEHLKNRKKPKIVISREDEMLDTGGGVRKRIDFFGDEPFYVLNADVVWTDGQGSALRKLAEKWDSSAMDILLLLHSTENLPAYAGRGDYFLAEGTDQPAFARNSDKKANFIFAGPRIVHPKIFEGAPEGAFSFLQLFHKAEKQGRLFALRHDGEWHHVGTPEAFEKTNLILKTQGKAKERKIAP
jgi:MurNAc alpha-1-phosphate uridylyltransferase